MVGLLSPQMYQVVKMQLLIKTGLIVNVKDPLNLAKGILKLSKNRKILNSMSKNSREHAIKILT